MNKLKSYIYKDIDDCFLKKTGYFDAKDFNALSDDNFIDNVSNKKINKNTKVIYFNGSFGYFHEGHLSVIKRAYEEFSLLNNNLIIVISPSNSDYSYKKYGNTSFANNYDRYQRILNFKDELIKYNVVIDLNPMLNNDIDYNFTDQLKYFLIKNINKDITKIKNKPILIAGKDRDYSLLNNLTKEVKFRFYEKEIDESTSDKKYITKKTVNIKKDLYLRINNKKEYDIFCKYMKDYYNKITPIYINNEKIIIKEIINRNKEKYITICKDYADILKYIKVSRYYENPLSKSKHIENKILKKEKNKTVIDSDVYTGGTKKFIEQHGLMFWSLIDLSKKNKNIELIDIEDIKDEKYKYPYVDISSKCSLPPFNENMHKIFKELKKEIGKI